MKDDFNFEETLGRLAQSLENKKYADAVGHIKMLASHPEHKDAVQVILSTFDCLEENMGGWDALASVEALLKTLPPPKSNAEKELQKNILQKWSGMQDRYAASSPDNALMHLTHVNQKMDAANPLKAQALAAWEKLMENSSVSEYQRQSELRLSNDIENADFRLAVLKKLAAQQLEKPDETLDILYKAMEEYYFTQFNEKDPTSAKLFIQTMANILKERASGYEPKKKRDITWKILSNGASIDAASAKIGAKYYLDVIKNYYEDVTPDVAFLNYVGVIHLGQKNKSLSAEVNEAREKILDAAEAGKFKDWYSYNRAADYICEEILRKGGAEKGLADREVNVLLSQICKDMSEKGRNWEYAYRYAFPLLKELQASDPRSEKLITALYSNVCEDLRKTDKWNDDAERNALRLLEALPANDPRNAELMTLCKNELKIDYKAEERYSGTYISHIESYLDKMGQLLDVATRNGDDVHARYAETAWKEGIEKMTAKDTSHACEYLRKQAESKKSATTALAKTILPAIEKRVGEPKAVDSTEFLKRFGGGKKGPPAP